MRTRQFLLLLLFAWNVTSATVETVELEGKVVCLAEEMHTLYEAELPTLHNHIVGFKTKSGEFYTLLRTTYSEALFSDEEVRKRTLVLKGRLFPDTRVLEVSRIRSIVDGKLHDVFYYCDVCSIKALGPGICDCCQGPNRLVEKPVP